MIERIAPEWRGERRADDYPVVRVASPAYFARLHARLHKRLPMWIVYRPTTVEYPGKWAARMHVIQPSPRPTRFVITHDHLDGLRDLLPPGLVRIERSPADPEVIEECWF